MEGIQARPLWIAGTEESGHGEIIHVENPATGEIIDAVQSANTEDVQNAISRAQECFDSGVWSRAPVAHRATILEKTAALLSENIDTLITHEVLQTGRAIREMKAQVPSLTRWFTYFAALLRTEERSVLPTTGDLHNWVERVPLGVVALITPFNHPLLIAVKKVVPALAAGNSVILKPSELTPTSSLLLGRLLKQAGLPDGAFSVLPGYGATTGKDLVSHPLIKKVDVTGGTEAGKAIGGIIGRNLTRYTAELGGKAPVIIFDKADVDSAVNGVVFGGFIASGQTCVAATRILVQDTVYDEVLEKLARKSESIRRRMGSPMNLESSMGPVISRKQLDRMDGLVKQAIEGGFAKTVCGGEILTGRSELDGTDFSRGHFYPPTILRSSFGQSILQSSIWSEEAFGPILVIVSFTDEKEAISLANDSQYGLGAAIWTDDLPQGFRVSQAINAGIVWVNTHHRNDPSSPWGGVKTGSGVGSENGRAALADYSMVKSTVVNYAGDRTGEDWFGEGVEKVRYG